MQPHLKKCFEGVAKLQFTEDQKVTAIISSEKEHVPLSKTIVPADAKVSTLILILLLCLERELASPPPPPPPGYGGEVVTAGTRGDDSELEGCHDAGSDRVHTSPSDTVGDRLARSGRHRSKLHLLDY